MNTGEILGVSCDDLEQVISGPSHQVAFENIGNPRDCFFKRIQNFVGLTRKRYFNKNRCWHADFARVQQCYVVADAPIFLKTLDPAVSPNSCTS